MKKGAIVILVLLPVLGNAGVYKCLGPGGEVVYQGRPCDGGGEAADQPPPGVAALPERWYAGGNLHQRTAREWHSADYLNRMATSADFLVATGVAHPRDMDDLKARSLALEGCITEATNDPRLYEHKVSEIGALCLVMMDQAPSR